MRCSRILLGLMLLFSMGFEVASSTATAGFAPGSSDQDPHTPNSQMSGSVVVRETSEVSAASVDIEAYAAGRYVVTFASSVDDVLATTDKLAKKLGFEPTHVYTARVRGFASRLSDRQVASLKRDSEVVSVETDDVIPAPSAFNMPTGVERVGTLANSTAKIDGVDQRVNVDVAVIDSGIDFDNPDLNIAGWFDCTSSNGDGWDEVGHGTHVAGTIGALDNGSGVTGVAPGARIWPIKIFTGAGGLESWAICGVETATDYGSQIDVANLSWGWRKSNADGACSNSTIHQAICNASNAGITLVAAAGNQGRDAAGSVPATFSQVITVSAYADSDGKIGGKGGSTGHGCDDCFADFSNFGADVDLAAPGVDIVSTCPSYLFCNAGTGLAEMSGTSMSTPHVSGAAALYIARNGRVGPAKVRSALIAISDPVSITGDPDGIHERVLYTGNLKPNCSLNPTAGAPETSATLTCTGFRASETVNLTLDATSTRIAAAVASTRGSIKTTFTIPKTTRGAHKFVAKGRTSKTSKELKYSIRGTITRTPVKGPAATKVTLVIAGFAANETLTVRFDPGKSGSKTLKSNFTADSKGSKTFTVTIPDNATAGTHRIEVAGSAGSKVARDFSVTPSTPSAAEGGPTATPTSTPEATATLTPDETGTTEPPITESATGEPTSAPPETATPEPTPTDLPPTEPAAESSPTSDS